MAGELGGEADEGVWRGGGGEGDFVREGVGGGILRWEGEVCCLWVVANV